MKVLEPSWLRISAWSLLSQGLVVLTGALVGIIVARVGGATTLGEYAGLSVVASIGSALGTFRLDLHLVSSFGEGEVDDSRPAILIGFTLSSLLAPLAVLVAVVALDASVLEALLVAGLIVVSPLRLWSAPLQSYLRQREIAVAALTARCCWLLAIATLWLLGTLTTPGLLLAKLASDLLEGLLFRRSASALPVRRLAKVSFSSSVQILRRSAPLAATGLAGLIYNRIDQAMLLSIVSAEETGLYAAAVRLAEMALIGTIAVQAVALPKLVASAAQPDHWSRDLRAFAILVCAPLALFVLLAVPFAGPVLGVLFGSTFSRAGPTMVILALGAAMSGIGAVVTGVALAKGFRSLLVISTIAGAGTNIGLNLVLLPRFGIAGAAVATLVSYATAMCLVWALKAQVRQALRPARVTLSGLVAVCVLVGIIEIVR